MSKLKILNIILFLINIYFYISTGSVGSLFAAIFIGSMIILDEFVRKKLDK